MLYDVKSMPHTDPAAVDETLNISNADPGSRPVETSYPVLMSQLTHTGLIDTATQSQPDLNAANVRNRFSFITKARESGAGLIKPAPDFATDKVGILSGSLDAVTQRIVGGSYAEKFPDLEPPKIPVDYNPMADSIDRPVIMPKVPEVKSGNDTPKAGPVRFSPFRIPVWRAKKNVPINDTFDDLQAHQDMQIPHGRYILTLTFSPDPDGGSIEFFDPFPFSVDGKEQVFEKGVIDFVNGRAMFQIYVRENLIWILALGGAAVAALGYAMGETADVLAQVDRILINSWIPVAAAGGALCLYLIYKKGR